MTSVASGASVAADDRRPDLGQGRPEAPRAASFDVWLTLIRSNPRFKAERNDLIRAAVAPDADRARFANALRQADVDADRRAETTGRDHDMGDRLKLTLGVLGRGSTHLDASLVEELLARQHDLALELLPEPLDPSLPGLLDELASVVPLAITSNTGMLPAGTMRALLAEIGLLDPFTVRTFSDEVGAAKPEARIFAATLAGLQAHVAGLAPGDVVHVGDNPHADVTGAQDAGMIPVRVDATCGTDRVVSAMLAGLDQGRP